MRIAILSALFLLLLLLNLGVLSADSVEAKLETVRAFPEARGTVRAEIRGGQAVLNLNLAGLSQSPLALLSNTFHQFPATYVVWLWGEDGQLRNIGAIRPDPHGDATIVLGPLDVVPEHFALIVTAEASPTTTLPLSLRNATVLTGQIDAPSRADSDRLTNALGPGWLLPLSLTTIGLYLLRFGFRLRHEDSLQQAAPQPDET